MKKAQFDLRIFPALLILLLSVTIKTLLPDTILPEPFHNSVNLVMCWEDGKLSIVDICPGAILVPQRVKPLFFEKISVNKADSQLLQTIPGIGPGLAGNIITRKEQMGQISSQEDLLTVHGIGEKRKEMFLERLSFD